MQAKFELAPLADKGELDFSGFKQELIDGDQNGWALVHIQGVVGSLLAGNHEVVAKQFKEDRTQLEG